MTTRALQQPLPAWEDSAVERVLWGDQSLPGVVSKSGRKQHRSCDQCRKGKKGCDAVILKDFGNSLADSNVEGSWGRGVLEIHSNCSCWVLTSSRNVSSGSMLELHKNWQGLHLRMAFLTRERPYSTNKQWAWTIFEADQAASN